MSDLHRWNFEAYSGGALLVCKNLHDKGHPCEYKTLTIEDVEAMSGRLAKLEARLAAESEKYSDLIMQVQEKIPGETRHETAKRIIQQHEAPDNMPAQATAPEQEGE